MPVPLLSLLALYVEQTMTRPNTVPNQNKKESPPTIHKEQHLTVSNRLSVDKVVPHRLMPRSLDKGGREGPPRTASLRTMSLGFI